MDRRDVPAASDRPTPVYKKWWLWTIVGGVVVAGVVVGVTVAVLNSGDDFHPSLGKVDGLEAVSVTVSWTDRNDERKKVTLARVVER